MGKNRRRIYALISVVAMVGASLAVAPALGDDHVPPPPDAVSFEAGHLQGPRFTYPGAGDQILATETRPNTCKLISSGPQLLALTGDGQPVGMNNLGIGIRTSGSNANGTPCSQVDSSETLEIAPGSALGGKWFSRVELDLELTGNAIVEMTLSGGSNSQLFKLYTGTNWSTLCDGLNPDAPGCTPLNPPRPHEVNSGSSPDAACSSPQNSGPNAGVNDNCIWKVDPGFAFDKISITTSVGTVSLEGGSETGIHSKFFLADNTPEAEDDFAFIPREDVDIDIDVLENDSPSNPSPGIFDTLVVSPTKGTAEILGESGAQFIKYTPNHDPDHATLGLFDGSDQFEYRIVDSGGPTATVFVYELFDCEDELNVGPDEDGVEAVYERLPAQECPPKSYVLDITTTDQLVEGGEDEDDVTLKIPTILFQPRTQDPIPDCSIEPDECTEEFKGTITFKSRDAANPFDMGTLEYEPAFVADPEQADFQSMEWCVFDPFNIPVAESEEDQLERRDALPDLHSWCIVSATNVVQADGKVKTTWVVYGIGDPLKRVS